MPTVRKPDPIAIAVSDLHLSLTQPVCRADKDWLEVQAGYLEQLKRVARAYGVSETGRGESLPILCAGDIFDKWNAPPELINFALEHLPDDMLCVPGQHDLPLHRIEDKHRSGYGVLAKAEKIWDLSEGRLSPPIYPFVAYGFGWEEEITPPAKEPKLLHIAVVHRYCWIPGKSFPDAPKSSHVFGLLKKLHGYDVAITGDNHQNFLTDDRGEPRMLNPGTFIRRKFDEIKYTPKVGIIYSDRSIKQAPLDTSGDKFHETDGKSDEIAFNMRDFIIGLEKLGEHGLDFRAAVENHLKTEDLDPRVQEIILQAMEPK